MKVRRQQSRTLDVQSFSRADCDPDRYLVVVDSKQTALEFHMRRLCVEMTNDAEVKDEYETIHTG